MRHKWRIDSDNDMPRPKKSSVGKVTDFRTDLDSFRRHDEKRFKEEIDRVRSIYMTTGSIKATAKKLEIGKRTLERAMSNITELADAIESARVLMGR